MENTTFYPETRLVSIKLFFVVFVFFRHRKYAVLKFNVFTPNVVYLTTIKSQPRLNVHTYAKKKLSKNFRANYSYKFHRYTLNSNKQAYK